MLDDLPTPLLRLVAFGLDTRSFRRLARVDRRWRDLICGHPQADLRQWQEMTVFPAGIHYKMPWRLRELLCLSFGYFGDSRLEFKLGFCESEAAKKTQALFLAAKNARQAMRQLGACEQTFNSACLAAIDQWKLRMLFRGAT